MKNRLVLLGVVAWLALLPACGSDPSDPAPTPTAAPSTIAPTTSPRLTATPAPTPTPRARPILWIAGCGDPRDGGCICQRNQRYCEQGVLARSEDLGDTWTRTFFSTGLGSVDFPTASHGWAVGASGFVVRTTDGGATWQPKTDGIELPARATARGVRAFNTVRFRDAMNGIIAGYGVTDEVIGVFGPSVIYRTEAVVLFTADGGETWSPATILGGAYDSDGNAAHASTACFSSDGTGVIAGSPPLLTRDGGRTWENIYERVERGAGSWGAACDADGTLWMSAGAAVVRSDDRGETWTLINDPAALPFNCCFAPLDFTSESRGWRAGEQILRTDDGGATWSEVDAALPESFGAIALRFATPDDGLWTTVGADGVTHDGGASWRFITVVPFREGLFGLADIAVIPPASEE